MPSTSNARDEQRARLLAQIDAAHAALKELDAKKKPATQPKPEAVKKPMTLRERMNARAR